MAKYNWDIETIQERYYECTMLWDKETDPDLKELYFVTALSLKNYLESSTPTGTFPLLELYNFEREDLKDREFLWDIYQQFSNINPKIIPNTPKLKTTSLTPKDILDLTHDFYKSLNPFFFQNFMQQFSKRKDHIKFERLTSRSECDGTSIFIPHRNESFIEVFRDYTLDDVLTSIHEYGHVTSYNINFLNKFAPHFYYTEIITLFLELIAADYLGTIFGLDNAIVLKASTHNTMCEIAKITSHKIDLIIAEDLLPNGYRKNKDLKNVAKDLLNLDSSKTEYLFNSSNLEISDYTIGYIIATELYFIYLEDAEKALHILKKLLLYKAKSELDYFNTIKKLGIVPNLHTQEYSNILHSEVLTLTRKQ